MRGGSHVFLIPNVDAETLRRGQQVVELLSKLQPGQSIRLFPSGTSGSIDIPLEIQSEGSSNWQPTRRGFVIYSDADAQGAELRDDGKLYFLYSTQTVRFDPRDIDWNDNGFVTALKETGIIS